MTLQTAGRGAIVLLAMLFCLDIQSHARQVEADVKVSAIFHCIIPIICFKLASKKKALSPGRVQLVAHSDTKTKTRG